MIDYDLLKSIIIVSMASSIISAAIIQKIKENLKTKKWLLLISFGVTISTGILFSLTFSGYNIIHSCWVGLISFVGADVIYQMFEDKIFTSFKNLSKNAITEIERDD